MKPIALDDLVVNDGETWLSKLPGAMGRPAAQAVLARRAGNWPLVADVELREDVLHLATYVERTDEPRSAKALLYRMVQPEQTLLRRLLAADYELPGSAPDALVLALGPWDMAASGDTWTARDLLRPDDLAATLEGEWEISDGGLYLHRDNEPEVTVDNPATGSSGTLEVWYQPDDDYTGPTRYIFSTTACLALWFDESDDCFHLSDGTNEITSAAQTFAAGALLHLVAQWSAAGLRLYIDGTLAASGNTFTPDDMTTLWLGSANDVGEQCDGVLYTVRAWDVALTAGQVRSLYRRGWDWQARWLEVTPLGCVPVVEKGRDLPHARLTALQVGDRLWRSPGQPARTTMDDDGATATVTNDGDADAYPIIRLTPRQAKAGGYAYARWVAVLWNGSASGGAYPTLLGEVDTAALVTAGKALASGDDWRVFVDGVEVARWFGSGAAAFNQATTKTWVNLDWEAAATVDLETAIGSGDTVESVDAADDISGFPNSGVFVIEHGGNYEAFTYTGKNDPEQRFTGVTRAAKGTTALDLDPGDTITWIQHDVWLYYGDAGAAAPSYDDNYQPIIDLDDSDNETWVYNEFGENDGLRPGAWHYVTVLEENYGKAAMYTADHGTDADPWEEIGITIEQPSLGYVRARWWIYLPCGIVAAEMGERYVVDSAEYKSYLSEDWTAYASIIIQSSSDGSTWNDEYSLSITSDDAWHSWYRDEALDAGAFYVALFSEQYNEWLLAPDPDPCTLYVEVAEATLEFDSDLTPGVVIGDEQGNYTLALTIENEDAGEVLAVAANLALDETLVIDCDAGTCLLEPALSNQIAALTTDAPRARWLRLLPGDNSLVFTDTGTVDLDIDVLWERRLAE